MSFKLVAKLIVVKAK